MKSISVLNKLFRSSFKNNSNNKPNKNLQISKHIIVAPGQCQSSFLPLLCSADRVCCPSITRGARCEILAELSPMFVLPAGLLCSFRYSNINWHWLNAGKVESVCSEWQFATWCWLYENWEQPHYYKQPGLSPLLIFLMICWLTLAGYLDKHPN